MKTKNEPAAGGLDISAGKEAADAFAYSTGIACRLYSASGEELYEQSGDGCGCAFRGRLLELTGAQLHCEGLHAYASEQSERFGGRYIYFCPLGASFVACPIMSGGRRVGSLVAGPVTIVQPEELLESDALGAGSLPPERLKALSELISGVPAMTPQRLGHISNQLFASAVYLSDSAHELFISRSGHELSSTADGFISDFGGAAEAGYPFEDERELCGALSRGDRAAAEALLPKLLAFIYASGEDELCRRLRIAQLHTLLSRAAVSGGADENRVFAMSRRFIRELPMLSDREAVAGALYSALNGFLALVFATVDVKHTNALRAAFDLMNREYDRPLTLGEVARRAGYSPSYFSRVFREDLGATFKESLNRLRIEKSKPLLLSSGASVSEIASMVGFNDQSYFCKTFRRLTGVTPDRFRKRSRRIDTEKEHGF